jgi:hypothetical protein
MELILQHLEKLQQAAVEVENGLDLQIMEQAEDLVVEDQIHQDQTLAELHHNLLHRELPQHLLDMVAMVLVELVLLKFVQVGVVEQVGEELPVVLEVMEEQEYRRHQHLEILYQ